MRVIVITPPAPLIEVEDAKEHLRVLHDDEDALITAYVAAATGHIDGPDGWLGRALGVQTLEARVDGFCAHGLLLPYQPVIDIVSVKYLDADAAEQTFAADQYELLGRNLVTARGVAWPTTLDRREAIRVRYRAGYVADPDADPLVAALPAPIRAAILLMVGDLYAFRETAAVGAAAAPISMSTTVENLLAPFRVWS